MIEQLFEYNAEDVDESIELFFNGLCRSRLFLNDNDVLVPYATKIAGTKDALLRRTRAYAAANYATRVLAPIVLRADIEKRFYRVSLEMELLPFICNEHASNVAQKLAKTAVIDKTYGVGHFASFACFVAREFYDSERLRESARCCLAIIEDDSINYIYEANDLNSSDVQELLRTKSLELLDLMIDVNTVL